MKSDGQATAHYQSHATELEHQRLVARCHALVAAIGNRPGANKLLKGILPTLELFAGYKQNRSKRRTSRCN